MSNVQDNDNNACGNFFDSLANLRKYVHGCLNKTPPDTFGAPTVRELLDAVNVLDYNLKRVSAEALRAMEDLAHAGAEICEYIQYLEKRAADLTLACDPSKLNTSCFAPFEGTKEKRPVLKIARDGIQRSQTYDISHLSEEDRCTLARAISVALDSRVEAETKTYSNPLNDEAGEGYA